MDFTNLKNFMDHMALKKTPGNCIEVYLDGEKVFQYASGYSDLENKIYMTGEERFNLYSCSKITTVTAALQLLEQGKYHLSDPLYEYIPEFRNMYVKTPQGGIKKAQNPITIRDLFTMSGGFNYDFNSEGFVRAKKVTNGSMDTLETIKCVAADPLDFEPGTHWQYSICHDVLAAFVCAITDQKFRDYVKEHVFEPLEMYQSDYHPTAETLGQTAKQYLFVSEGQRESDIVTLQRSGNQQDGYFKEVSKYVEHILGEEYDSGGAGINSTVSDYAKLLIALSNDGTGKNGEKILSKGTVELMRTNHLDENRMKDFNWKQLEGYGYGLGVRTHVNPIVSGCISSIGEFGWSGAAGSIAIMDPKYKLAVFYAQHTLNPREEYYQPRLKNAIYSCL